MSGDNGKSGRGQITAHLAAGAAIAGAVVLLAGAFLFHATGNQAGLTVCLTAAAVLLPVTLHSCGEEKKRRLANERAAAAEAERQRAEAELAEAKEKILRCYGLISHGLRVPISIIMGYADILLGKMIADESVRDEYLRKMGDKAAYINELLTYSLLDLKPDAELRSPARQPFELLGLLRGIAEAMKEIAERNEIMIYLVSEQEEIYVKGNSIGLSKAFYNIIENAMKYMGRPGSLNITASLLDEEVFIAFKDDGAGIAEEEAEHLFDMNYQGSNARNGHGHGLGLWIVRTEVASHGGNVYAKSEKGAGLGIYIMLPLN
ncbi:MAG: HAMP domain-containing histidine kinase [Gracilibacteraceae bacterium]|jgi:signal transduction histidine kinase|nr:HAMP domain-containing histidine kinase [Gracilibacteraceae bacterium]